MNGPDAPPTRAGEQVDDHHGEVVADPYRWLEDTNAPETRAWIAAQNEVTQAWLSSVPARDEIRARLGELWDYPKYGVPFERGGRWFQSRNSGLQDQSVLWVMSGPEEEGRVLLDPNRLSEDGTVAVSSVAVTDDGSLLAYATSAGGSDWMTWHVRDVASGTDLPDTLDWSKYGGAAWRRDATGFYYTALDAPSPGAELTEKSPPRRIMFHRLGTTQRDDEVVFAAPEQPEFGPDVTVTEDGRFVVISVSEGTAPEAEVHVIDLEDRDGTLLPLVTGFTSKAHVVTSVGSRFYLVTDHGAERQRIVAVDLGRHEREHWEEVVPESGDVLLAARHCGGKLVCHYLSDACSRLRIFELDGAPVREVDLPAICSVVHEHEESGVEGRPDAGTICYAVTSFTDSGSLWAHDLATGETRQLRPPACRIDPSELVSEQVFVEASDGAVVPLFLTRRRDAAPDGETPVLLYGYGGFDVPITPGFAVDQAVFVERGGMLAVAVLRGGGEYGRSWHEAGSRAHKQRVFDDFCACARWLAASGWTRAGRIVANGGSNGGLLVGACITQHPELFGAAVAEVGVFDMLRFHEFTIGWAWKSDYGDPDDPEQYRWVRAYSPLHHVVPGRSYPPVLLTTGDHDDRVIPGHSFKFAATLQAARPEGASAPALIRVDTSTGHGHGMPTSKAIAERADVLAFAEGAVGTS